MLNNLIDWIIENGGIYFLLLVVFAETGLFIGFFLPGDSLLFAAGIKMAKLSEEFYGTHWSIIILLVALSAEIVVPVSAPPAAAPNRVAVTGPRRVIEPPLGVGVAVRIGATSSPWLRSPARAIIESSAR